MAVQLQGFSGVVDEVDSTFRARRVVQYPLDVTQNSGIGSFALASDNGTTVMSAGLAANSGIYQFRWTHATVPGVLRSVRFSMGAVTAFVAGQCRISLFFSRSFTVAGTGGAAATITGNNNKKRTSFGTTVLGEARTATTAALGAGTKTNDSQPMGGIATSTTTAAGPIITNQFLWNRDTSDEYPVVLAQNEGLEIQATVAGTGTWYFGVVTEWGEPASF